MAETKCEYGALTDPLRVTLILRDQGGKEWKKSLITGGLWPSSLGFEKAAAQMAKDLHADILRNG